MLHYKHMIPGVDLVELVKYIGVFGVAALIFAESGLLIGFFLPGDSLIFTAGFLVQAGFLPINIHALALLLFIAAVLGDNVGYAFGKRVGPRLFKRKDSLLFQHENIERAEKFYEKHGGKTIIIARFFPVIRTFVPIIAGVGKMEYKTFFTYNIIGGFVWAVGNTYLGYFVGGWFKSMGIEIDTVLLPIIFVIVLLSILPPLIHVLRDQKQRRALVKLINTQYRKLVKKFKR